MQLGILISSTGLKLGSFRVAAELAAEMGYDFVELGMNVAAGEPACADLGPCSADEAQFISADIRSAGVEISAIQCHTGFISPDATEVERNVELTKRAVDYAAHMQVPFVHTVTGPLRPDMEPVDAWAMVLDAYQDILAHAATTPVRLGIEPVFAYLVGNLDTTRTLLDKLGRDDLYINFDPSHFPYHRESPLPFLKEFSDRIIHAHAKDAHVEPLSGAAPAPHSWDMGGGSQFRFAAPGKGLLDWTSIVAGLRENGFDGVLSLELGHGVDDEEQAARENVMFFRKLLGQV